MRWEYRERFPRYHGLAIPTYISARGSRTCGDACRDRLLVVSFEVSGGENVPGIPGACATCNLTYLVRGLSAKYLPIVKQQEYIEYLEGNTENTT